MTYKISVIIPAFNEEKYLSNALESLINQNFKDFEVIIINDGSTDDTQKIIDEYCINYSNFRGIYQKNSGVSTARNRGIKESKADYVAFLDADDIYVEDALENLYKTAILYDAELVIGRMKIVDVFGSSIYRGPIKLSNIRNIDPFDKELVWTGSMCNKLFSKKKLLKTGTSIPKLKYDEDSTFILDFALKCNKIVGCPYDIVLYQKRPFWEGYSVTQAVNIDYIKDYLKAYEIIGSLVQDAFQERIDDTENFKEKKDLHNKYQKYFGELCHRRIAILCNEFYRLFWKADDNSLKLINQSMNEIKKEISVEAWDEYVEKFNDLRINNLIYDKKEMANNPLMTIVINLNKIRKDEINFLLGSIYSDNFPAFEVIVPHGLLKIISDDYCKKENLKGLISKENFKNQSLKAAKGNCIIFIEDNIFFKPGALRSMYNYLQNPEVDFIAVQMYQQKDNRLVGYIHQILSFSYRNIIENSVKSRFNNLDLYLSNKLIKTDYLRENKFTFSNNSPDDVFKLYNKAEFRKYQQKCILSTQDEKTIIKSLQSNDKSLAKNINMFLLSRKIIYCLLKVRRFVQKSWKKINKSFTRFYEAFYIFLLKKLPLRKRAFFYSIRSDDKLADNSLVVFNKLDASKIYISKKHPHYRKIRLKILYYLLTSKVIVTDDYVGYLRRVKVKNKQKIIQIWHAGGAFKKFGLDAALTFDRYEKEVKTHAQYDAVIVSSNDIRKYYASAFGISIDKIKPLGIPRTDMFFDKNKKIITQQLYKQLPILKNKNIILYCPTFRENDLGRRIPFDTKINWAKLSSSLNENTLFIIRNHPVMEEDLLNGEKYDNIINLSDIPTDSLLFISNIMITDYSSVIFDYSLFNKPIIFYCPDYDDYTRNFYLEYPEDLPGKMVKDSDELINEIKSLTNKPPKYNLDNFKNIEMGACDGRSTDRVVKLIKDYLS